MDYTAVLTQIASNQTELLAVLNSCKNALECIFMLFGIYFIYVFIRNLIKAK